jgi:DNA-binding winged helix-turn-helix (wHTH) protein
MRTILHNCAQDAMTTVRFGRFELDAKREELRKDGEIIKLPPQPFKVLLSLAMRSGEMVTRGEIRQEIWRDDTFVDFDQALNFCIRQIREALEDDADAPRYIETLRSRGYRFLPPVETAMAGAPARATRLIVLPFRMLRPDAETDFLAFSLPDAITVSLSGLQSLIVRSSVAASRFRGDLPDPKQLAEEADVDAVVTGSLIRVGDQLRVSTQLTAVPAGTLLWSQTSQTSVGELFQLQDELTHRIVDSLAIPLTASDRGLLVRNVPSSERAYDYYLRGNQLSHDRKQWAAARDLYLRAVADDPQYAPAWARLGRMHHVMGKYIGTSVDDSLGRSEAAFRRALEINPELPIAHKLYAQLEVDLGRAPAAMVRLLERAGSADSEIFAGLVSACRYCGLLEASLAADAKARSLEPRIRTSVPHTWFQMGDYERVATRRIDETFYIGSIAFASVGRTAEAIAAVAELEPKSPPRARDILMAARTLLEGRMAESLAAVRRVAATDFRDPEGLFYLARHLAHLKEKDAAVQLFQRVVRGGFCCYPAVARDPWLDSIRGLPEFAKLLRDARTKHREAEAAFERAKGDVTLGMSRSARAHDDQRLPSRSRSGR